MRGGDRGKTKKLRRCAIDLTFGALSPAEFLFSRFHLGGHRGTRTGVGSWATLYTDRKLELLANKMNLYTLEQSSRGYDGRAPSLSF